MKRILVFIMVTGVLQTAHAQQQNQIQARRGIFTDWLYIKDRWINHVSTDLNTADSLNENGLATSKAIADYVRQRLAEDTIGAGNGLTIENNQLQLGQALNAAGNPSSFTGSREIYLNGNNFKLRQGTFIVENNLPSVALLTGNLLTVSTSSTQQQASISLQNNLSNSLKLGITGSAYAFGEPNTAYINSTNYPISITTPGMQLSFLKAGIPPPDTSGTIKVMIVDSLGMVSAPFLPAQVSLRNYRSYMAILSQSGTAAPTATLFENTLGNNITWTYISAGRYKGTLSAGIFPDTKTWAMSAEAIMAPGGVENPLSLSDTKLHRLSDTEVELIVANDDDWTKLNIEIRVYE